MKFEFPELFLLFSSFVFAAGANLVGKRILRQMGGVQAQSQFQSVFALIQQFAQYRESAAKNGWPTWPVPVFWIMAVTSIILGAAWALLAL